LALKPLFFEVPQQETKEEAESTQFFWGRPWIFRELSNRLLSPTIGEQSALNQQQSRGVIISGGTGSGKTHVALQLVEYSCFGRSRIPIRAASYRTESNNIYENPYASSSGESIYGRTTQAGPQAAEIIQSLAARLVAYHFCQVRYSTFLQRSLKNNNIRRYTFYRPITVAHVWFLISSTLWLLNFARLHSWWPTGNYFYLILIFKLCLV